MDIRSSRHAEYDQGHVILKRLQSACLLEGFYNSSGDECVRMHDLCRDMAFSITRKQPRFMVKSGLQLKEIPLEHEWTEDLNKVSLMFNRISVIPANMSPRCHNLVSLSLRSNPLAYIPDSFFQHMKSLQTLDLSETKIEILPHSVSLLVTLKALLLKKCIHLVSLPSLKNLKALTELDLSFTGITKAVHGLESLTNLKCLALDHSSLEMIPPGSLHALSHLQRITLPLSDCVKVEEVMGLRNLEEFKGCFADMDDFRQFVISRNSPTPLISYLILVGRCAPADDFHLFGEQRNIFINNNNFGDTAVVDEIMLPLWDVRRLRVFKGDYTKCILRLMEDRKHYNHSPLQNLQSLHLVDLPNLRNIIEWEGGVTIHTISGTFLRLTELKIEKCNGMRKLLPRCLVDNLGNLEMLHVSNCGKMEEIVEENMLATTQNHVNLPKLRKLYLENLPKLKSIGKSNIICNSFDTICIRNCRKFKKFPLFLQLLNTQPSPRSAHLRIELASDDNVWCDSLKWDHPDHKSSLQPFVEFI